MRSGLLFMLILCCVSYSQAQHKPFKWHTRALDAGVYDGRKVKKNRHKIYYDKQADDRFMKDMRRSKSLQQSGVFGEALMSMDSIDHYRENEVIEYCPKLGYVLMTGGHGYILGYDLNERESLYVNPSTYVCSPSGYYRFGTFEEDGMRYYLEVREADGEYATYQLCHGQTGEVSGVYWDDDNTLHYLVRERNESNGKEHWVGYSTTFIKSE